jgi:hypothetical protein
MPSGKQTRTLPDFGSCFVKRAKRTSRRPEPLSLRRYRPLPETIPAPAAQPPSRLLQCAPVVCSCQSQRVQLCTLYSCLQYLLSGDLEIPVLIMRLLVFACWRNVVVSRPEMPGWSRTMMPDVYRHLAPTLGQNGFSFIRPTIAYRIRSANAIRMTIHSCSPLHLFTIGTPLETTSHILGKILSSVT